MRPKDLKMTKGNLLPQVWKKLRSVGLYPYRQERHTVLRLDQCKLYFLSVNTENSKDVSTSLHLLLIKHQYYQVFLQSVPVSFKNSFCPALFLWKKNCYDTVNRCFTRHCAVRLLFPMKLSMAFSPWRILYKDLYMNNFCSTVFWTLYFTALATALVCISRATKHSATDMS